MARRFNKPPREIGFAPKINSRARKIRLPSLTPKPVIPLPGMNQPESKVAYALNDLHIRYTAQQSFLGGTILGGARSDFTLIDYNIVFLFNGIFHGTTEGRARDAIVNQSYTAEGKRVIPLYDRDLPRIKPRILELIGRPL